MAKPVTQRARSNLADVDFIISCDPTRYGSDYVAKTASGLPRTDPYAIARHADQGLVRLMSDGGRPAQRYVIPRKKIQAVISVKYGMDELDRADLIFTQAGLVLVHTSQTNAGLFTVSDVYTLGLDVGSGFNKRLLGGDEDVLAMLNQGLAFYKDKGSKCDRKVG